MARQSQLDVEGTSRPGAGLTGAQMTSGSVCCSRPVSHLIEMGNVADLVREEWEREKGARRGLAIILI